MIRRTCLAIWLVAMTQAVLAQEQFATPEAAVAALAKAAEANDQARLDELFGPDYGWFQQGQQADPALAQLRFRQFAAALKEFRSLVPAG